MVISKKKSSIKTQIRGTNRDLSKITKSTASVGIYSKTANVRKPSKGQKRQTYLPRRQGKYWRIVIPHLDSYPRCPPRDHEGLQQLKCEVLDRLYERELKRGLVYWCVVWQTHPGTGYAHLDILLGYSKKVQNTYRRYDYLLKHGDLTRYRTLNKAIIEYGHKQDQKPLTNITSISGLLLEQSVKNDIYATLQKAMLEKPFDFQAHRWLNANDLGRAASGTNWPKNIRLIRKKQEAVCNAIFRNKPGIRKITRAWIESRLSAGELVEYDSWNGYQIIVDHLNQIPQWGCNRPHKTSNLFVTGPPNTGKTTLAMHLEKHCATYPLGTKGGWFPSFTAGVYHLMVWDEFNLHTLPYDHLLKLLEGRPMELPIKGGHAKRFDNQLIYMNSNLTLNALINRRFKKTTLRNISRTNLAPRITEVQIPKNRDLFLLLKLITPAEKSVKMDFQRCPGSV